MYREVSTRASSCLVAVGETAACAEKSARMYVGLFSRAKPRDDRLSGPRRIEFAFYEVVHDARDAGRVPGVAPAEGRTSNAAAFDHVG